ncbi:MAG: hypothetical protein WCJ01_02960 [Ignavibacteria bacterium]
MVFHTLFINFILFVGLIPGQSTVREWPAWFIYPQKYPKLVLGYGNSNYNDAKQNARDILRVRAGIRIKGTITFYSDNKAEDDGKHSQLSIEVDSSKLVNCRLFPFRKFYMNILNGEYLEAFAPDSVMTDTSCFTDLYELKKPAWTDSDFHEDNDFFYGAGCYTSAGRETDAWQTSELQALLTVIKNRYNNVFQIKLSEQKNSQTISDERIIVNKFDCELSDYEVVERYPDERNRLFYTLIRISKNSLIINR